MIKKILQLAVFLQLAFWAGCNSGGGSGGAAGTEELEASELAEESLEEELFADEETGGPQNPEDISDDTSSPLIITGAYLTGTVTGPDDQPLAGAEIYYYGDPETKAISEADGSYSIGKPSKDLDKTQLIGLFTNDDGTKSYGILSDEITPTAGQPEGDNLEQLASVNLKLVETGSIGGQVTLVPDLEDKSGIDVYLPGTGFIAKTDRDGGFLLSNIPEGSWLLRADFDGYFSDEAANVLVERSAKTEVQNLNLFLNLGPQFELVLNGGQQNSDAQQITVGIDVSPQTTLMRYAQNSAQVDVQDWIAIEAELKVTLEGPGPNTLRFQFADRNGQISNIAEYTMHYLDPDLDGVGGDADCAPQDPNLFTLKDYSFGDADGDGYLGAQTGQVCSGLTLPQGYKTSLEPAETQDCNDADATKYRLVEGYVDEDGDGVGIGALQSICTDNNYQNSWGATVGDCAPVDSSRYRELPLYDDTDNDGYGSGLAATACIGEDPPVGKSLAAGDHFPTDSNRWTEIGSFQLSEGSAATRTPIVRSSSTGLTHILGWAEDPFDAKLGLGKTYVSETVGLLETYLLTYDDQKNLVWSVAFENPQQVDSRDHIEIMDFASDNQGNLYLVGTFLNDSLETADFDFRTDQQLLMDAGKGILDDTRYLFLLKLAAADGSPVWYKTWELQDWTAQSVNNPELNGLKVTVGTTRVGLGGNLKGRLDIDGSGFTGTDAEVTAVNGHFILSFNYVGEHQLSLQGTPTETTDFGGLAFTDTDNLLLTYLEPGASPDPLLHIQKYAKDVAAITIFSKTEALQGNSGSAAGLEVTNTYVTYGYFDNDLPSIDQTFTVSRRLVANLEGLQSAYFYGDTPTNTVDATQTSFVTHATNTVYVQLKGSGPFMMKHSGAGSPQSLSADAINQTSNGALLKLNLDLTLQWDYELQNNFELTSGISTTPAEKILVPIIFDREVLSLPWGEEFNSFNRFGSGRELLWLEF